MWNCARCVARLKKNARARKSARKRYREQNPHLAEKSLRRCAAGPQIDISELPGEGVTYRRVPEPQTQGYKPTWRHAGNDSRRG